MDKLSDLYGTIDQLNPDELDQLSAYIEQKRMQTKIANEDPHTRAAALMAAVENFWEDLPQSEIDAIVEDMNAEYVEPLDDDWLSEEEDH
jgi:hypothetical protein